MIRLCTDADFAVIEVSSYQAADFDGGAIVGRYLGRRRMGYPLLRATWLSAGLGGGEGSTYQHLLEHSLAPARNLGGTGVLSVISAI